MVHQLQPGCNVPRQITATLCHYVIRLYSRYVIMYHLTTSLN